MILTIRRDGCGWTGGPLAFLTGLAGSAASSLSSLTSMTNSLGGSSPKARRLGAGPEPELPPLFFKASLPLVVIDGSKV